MLKLWELTPSPNNTKVRMALRFKGIDFEAVSVDPAERRPLLELTGQENTPTIQDRGIVLNDSEAILQYLDANYSESPRLFPRLKPGRRECDQWQQQLDERVSAPWLPLFLFAVLFGLSMDYHVFLLTRIREHFDQTGDNEAAVAHGLRTTGAIITGAALIMVAVFGGFAAGELVPLQQMGFGLAIAVFLDATVVRSILVPAAMRLLGDYNWYLPRWLEWLPRIEIEGHEAALATHERDAEPVAAGGAD